MGAGSKVPLERVFHFVDHTGDAAGEGASIGSLGSRALAAVVGGEQLQIRGWQQPEVVAADRLGLVDDRLLRIDQREPWAQRP